jgi:hypothetical protein
MCFIYLAASGNEMGLVGTYGRIITSFGPDGNANFAPRS